MKIPVILIGILVAMVVPLTGCRNASDALDENLDALELLSRSQLALETAGKPVSSVTDIDGLISMDMGIFDMSIPLHLQMEIESLERSSMKMDLSMMGMSINMYVFTRDGYQYTETSEFGNVQHQRVAVNTDEVHTAINVFNNLEVDAILEEWIEEATAVKINDHHRLTFIYNTTGILAFLENFDMMDLFNMEDFSDLIHFEAGDIDEQQLNDWQVTTVMYLDEDDLPFSSTTTLFFEIPVEQLGVTMDMTLDMTIAITYQDVTIQFPAWLDELTVD
ncbi:MAG: hypothetical protein FWG67_05670 [Defluviitaleaceae bacterium]|nr:hypothetical protein [Defluviitaleaceae bacterium]